MFKFFQDIRQHAASERTFKAVLELNKKGPKQEALVMCQKMANKHPMDIQFRYRLALLEKETGHPIDLPSLFLKLYSKP